MAPESQRWLVKPGSRLDVAKIDTSSTDGAPGDKDVTSATFPKLRHRLSELQERLWAERRQSLVLVLQAMDGGGKDGTIKHVFRGANPQGTSVTNFKAPSPEELDHDFLWRIHRCTPGRGELAVFNRSHYEDVLIVRVANLAPEEVWRPRFQHIKNFEALLHDANTRVVKIFLHISKEEQAERFRARLADPTKQWKFNPADLETRKQWDEYMTAYSEAIRRTATVDAPWYVVPADRKWYRNWAVSQILIETLTDMDPQFPEPDEDLSGIVID